MLWCYYHICFTYGTMVIDLSHTMIQCCSQWTNLCFSSGNMITDFSLINLLALLTAFVPFTVRSWSSGYDHCWRREPLWAEHESGNYTPPSLMLSFFFSSFDFVTFLLDGSKGHLSVKGTYWLFPCPVCGLYWLRQQSIFFFAHRLCSYVWRPVFAVSWKWILWWSYCKPNRRKQNYFFGVWRLNEIVYTHTHTHSAAAIH